MSGNEIAIQEAFRTVRNGGTVILFGLPSGQVRLNMADDIIFKEAHVRGIVGREIFKTWYRLEALLKSGKLDLRPLITHRMALNQIDDSMKLVASGECGKIVLTP
jgi:threonine 3-dehydrogenase